jgi:hypothetical protein
MSTRTRPWVGVALAGLCACNDVSCRWTDDPPPDPWLAHEPERSYPTADGLFDVVLHADGVWPPEVGTNSLRIEWSVVEGDAEGEGLASAARPFRRDGQRVADTEPVALELEPELWRIERLELDTTGDWIVAVTLEQGELDDSIELHLEVVEPP